MVGGAHGTGRVYEKGQYVGDTSITQLSVGFQAGGQAFSEIIFFENKAAFDIFTAGNFEMAATAQATAITASASASAGSTGASATASATKDEAATAGELLQGHERIHGGEGRPHVRGIDRRAEVHVQAALTVLLRPAEQIELPHVADHALEVETECREHRFGHWFHLLRYVVLAIQRIPDLIDWFRSGQRHHVADQAS